MHLYQKSTKTKPLLFFESFIKQEKLMKYEDMFYNSPFNPSQESFKDLGYIEYLNDYSCVADKEIKPIREYFDVFLKRLLDSQIHLTDKLLIDRRDEFEYQNIVTDIFIKRQLIIIENLRANIDAITVGKWIVSEALNTLENRIKKIIGGNLIDIAPKNDIIKTNKPFFEPKVKRKTLIELYNIALDNRVIDDEVVSETDFLNVLMSNNPKTLKNKIIFSVDNQIATFFLNSIMIFFYRLTPAQIARSQSFMKKSRSHFSQKDLDTAKSRYKKKEISKDFFEIQKAINTISTTNK